MVQVRAIFTIADQYKVAYGLSNGAIFNDLERPVTWFLRSRHSLTLNISQTDRQTDRFAISISRVSMLRRDNSGLGQSDAEAYFCIIP